MIESLRVSWAAGTAANPFVNFGDALSPIVVGFLCECDIQHSHFGVDGKLVAVGSILQNISGRSTIWGTGVDTRFPLKASPTDLEVWAVRGPITRSYLLEAGVGCPPVYGDPGVLVPLIVGPRVDSGSEVLLVPHLTQLDLRHPLSPVRGAAFVLPEMAEPLTEVTMLSPLVAPTVVEVLDIVRRIRDAKVVLTSSLHAFLIATTFGVPAAFLQVAPEDGPVSSAQMGKERRTVDGRIMDFWLSIDQTSLPPVWGTSRGERLDIAAILQFANDEFVDRSVECGELGQRLIDALQLPVRRGPFSESRIRLNQDLIRIR